MMLDRFVRRERKFGFSENVTDFTSTIWSGGGLISYPASPTVLEVISSSNQDKPGGTGAHTVEIYGLDHNWRLKSEVVTLAGTTPAETVSSYARVFRLIVRSGNVNAGRLQVRDDTSILSQVETGQGQTLQTFYTIPRGWEGHLKRVFVSTDADASLDFTAQIVAREFEQVFTVKEQYWLSRDMNVDINMDAPIFPPRTDIEMRAWINTDDHVALASAIFELELIRV